MKYYLRLFFCPVIMVLLVCCWSHAVTAAVETPIAPYESSFIFRKVNPIDEYIQAGLKAEHLRPTARCSDEVFIRRVFLDVIGTIPNVNEVTKFLKNNHPNKRAVLIEQLMARAEFADYWALKWGDLLRIKAA